jgi:hypothetical protein
METTVNSEETVLSQKQIQEMVTKDPYDKDPFTTKLKANTSHENMDINDNFTIFFRVWSLFLIYHMGNELLLSKNWFSYWYLITKVEKRTNDTVRQILVFVSTFWLIIPFLIFGPIVGVILAAFYMIWVFASPWTNANKEQRKNTVR